MNNSIVFGKKHAWRDWNLVLTDWDIPLPDVNEDEVEIPGMDGALDQTEFLAGATYKNRKLKFTFTYIGAIRTFHQKRQEIAAYLHGKVLPVVMERDPEYYYEGRCTVTKFDADGALATVEITCNAFPWKRRRITTKITRELTGTYQRINLYNERRRIVPTITVQYATTVRMNGKTYELSTGTYRILDFQLSEGLNIMETRLKNASSGTITIEYQEANF